MKIVLSLTHRCNLACKYCYSGRVSPQEMSLETAQKAVDFAMTRAVSGQPVDFHFFGGEPLLAFPLIQEITAYIQRCATELSIPIRFSITTNGTLLTESIFDFLNSVRSDLCISMDGPATVHDMNRVYPNGRGGFADTSRNLKRALEQMGHVQVNAVYSPHTLVHLPEAMRYFVDLGARIMRFNPNIQSPWSATDYEALRRVFMQMVHLYCECYQVGIEISVDFIDSKIILFLKGGYASTDTCQMASAQWAVAPGGNIYPCERLLGEDDGASPFILGNVHRVLERVRCQTIRAHVGNPNPECAACRLRRYGINWCGCTNYFSTGETDLTAPGLCAIQKASLQAAEHVLETLAASDTFVSHFSSYLCEASPYREGLNLVTED